MIHDVIIIGGSYSGMAAALQLVRARRPVLVVDAGLPRNRAASHAHGFISQDGTPPADIARGRQGPADGLPRAQLD
ncbi:FAD-dependent oxidoreductase [Acuticoccus sp. MNP-M23]|uniref:FAD-dependent oxidoreductase n=1 Tax=Acuticoccus sp. MNP-M23 TaxID=3072793 RepID=UPI002815F00C|nr:FAD-dependent oxidoreductase [Acuticoccus sp. MNP-M23]WMS41059.1 FAD-dependent oxidoreductase [Acuticoccus sp. MNP-M23]